MARGEKGKTGDAAACTIDYIHPIISIVINLLVANWRLLQEFYSPKIFSTRYGDQNDRSFERCVV